MKVLVVVIMVIAVGVVLFVVLDCRRRIGLAGGGVGVSISTLCSMSHCGYVARGIVGVETDRGRAMPGST